MSFLDIERGSKIDHRVNTGAIVDGAVTPPKLDRAYPQVVGGTISGGTIDGSYAYTFTSTLTVPTIIATNSDQALIPNADSETFTIEGSKTPKAGARIGLVGGNNTTIPGSMFLDIGDHRSGSTPDSHLYIRYMSNETFTNIFTIDKSGNITKMGWAEIGSTNDAAAPNSCLYFSTDQNKLVWKDSAGTVNVLY